MNIRSFRLNFNSGGVARFPLFFDETEVPGITGAISSRAAGNMVYSDGEKSSARGQLLRSLGLDGNLVYGCTQIHSREVLEVDRRSPNTRPEADGMISRDPAVTLLVTVADCLPVFLYDVAGGGMALVHSGWKGTGIALAALRLMGERWGSRPGEIAALLGPCIRGCCYRVDEARARSFQAEFGPGWPGGAVNGAYPLGPVIEEKPEGFFLNLQAANARLLANAGVQNIAVCEDCTFTDQRLGSFRREGAGYTRMAALLGRF